MTIASVVPRIGPADPVTAALNRVLIIDEYTDPQTIESILSALIVEAPRIRIGNRRIIDTLINEEALLRAKFLRDGTQ